MTRLDRTFHGHIQGSCISWNPGGTLNIYWHLKKGGGGLRKGYNPKKGGLRHRHNPKQKGLFGTGTSRKRGVLGTGLVKKTILVTDVAHKGGLEAYLLIIFTFFL